MSGRQHRSTPLLDLGRVADAVSKAVRSAPRSKSRKPTKAMLAFGEKTRATQKDRKAFHRLTSETTFYHGRYTIRRIGDSFEIWDAETHDVYGPYATHGDARIAVGGL